MVKSLLTRPAHGTAPPASRLSVVMKHLSPDLATMLREYVPLMNDKSDAAAGFFRTLKQKLRRALNDKGITPPADFKVIVPPGTLVLGPPPIRRASASAAALGFGAFAQRPTIGVLCDPKEVGGSAEHAQLRYSKYYKITATISGEIHVATVTLEAERNVRNCLTRMEEVAGTLTAMGFAD